MEEDTGVGMGVAELMGAEAAMEDIMTGLSLSTSNGILNYEKKQEKYLKQDYFS